jgi:hypothetical protein
LGGGDRISSSFENAPFASDDGPLGNFITNAARSFSKTGENAATALSVTTGKTAQHILIYYSINLT